MDHLGIVAMVCREIDLAGEIDRIVVVDPEYKHEEGDLDAVPIEITHGFSKDHRPDLKQFVISLIMSDDLPVFIQALSANASDKNHFREIVKEYGQSLREVWGEDKIWVWDSAVFSERNLGEISESYKWITRILETLSEAKEVLENADTEKMRAPLLHVIFFFMLNQEIRRNKEDNMHIRT